MVAPPFTPSFHEIDGIARYRRPVPDIDPLPPYLSDRDQLAAASDLIAHYGMLAADEAAVRAGRSRGVGNHIHFCRWRQVERLIDLLSAGRAVGTVH